MDDPFAEDPEWSDEEALLPKDRARRRQPIPPTVHLTSPHTTGETPSESGSGSLSSDPPRSVSGSPIVPPKSGPAGTPRAAAQAQPGGERGDGEPQARSHDAGDEAYVSVLVGF